MSLFQVKNFAYFSLSFILAVALASFWLIGIPWWIYLLFLFSYFLFPKNLKFLFLLIIFFLFGYLRYSIAIIPPTEQDISFYNNQEATFKGMIIKEPDRRDDHQKLTLKVFSLGDRKIKGRVLVKFPGLYPEYQYGDVLEASCRLKKPETIKNENTGKEFAYDKYLSHYNIYSLCYFPKIKKLDNQGNIILFYLLKIKNSFARNIKKVLPEPQASFLDGLLLGNIRGIPQEILDAARLTGTTHIIVVSGMHISIIAGCLSRLMQKLNISQKKGVFFIILAIFLFIISLGSPASVVRGGIMGTLVLLSPYFYKKMNSNSSLIIAAFLMLLINPKLLIFDIGFQLSFAATAGLIYLSPIIEKYLYFLPALSGFKETMVMTLSASIMTLPLIIYYFNLFSLVALLANLLVFLAIPYAMFFGFLSGLAGYFSSFLSMITGAAAWVFLSYIIFIIKTLSKIPYAAVEIEKFSLFFLILSYFFIGYWIYSKKELIFRKN